MGWISIIFVHKAVDALVKHSALADCERRALFASMGIDPGDPVDAKRMVADAKFFELLESIAHRHHQGRAIPVMMGAAMRCNHYGAFGLTFKSAPDLGGSYRRVERYGKVVTSIANFRVITDDQTAAMEIVPGRDQRLGLTMTNELAIAALTSLSREVSQAKFTPMRVEFMHDAPSDNTVQEAHFECPIVYNASRDALLVPTETLAIPNRLGDESISAFFDAHLDGELSAIREPSSLEDRTKEAIARALCEGPPRMVDIARGMGLSARSLHRRLADQGLKFQTLAQETRRELAEGLLRDEQCSLAEIAFLTGFSEQSSFTRAFKRWVGHTPASYRKARAGL